MNNLHRSIYKENMNHEDKPATFKALEALGRRSIAVIHKPKRMTDKQGIRKVWNLWVSVLLRAIFDGDIEKFERITKAYGVYRREVLRKR